MDYHGTARTNYVRIADLDGLLAAIRPFHLDVREHPAFAGHYAFVVRDGLWRWHRVVDDDRDMDLDTGLNVCKLIMPFVKDREVLILTDCSTRRHHYACAHAEAWRRHADPHAPVSICLHCSYAVAAGRFAIAHRHIGHSNHSGAGLH